MTSPALVDINGDGTPELVLSVSYFFDEDAFNAEPQRYQEVGFDINIHNYVAGGIVVFDLEKEKVVWSDHLDLTTDRTRLKAFIYSSPTVVDLDGDGDLEVILGTSLGFIYCFHVATGKAQQGFPLVMDEIQGQVAVEDVNGDGMLELIAMDKKGNVLCFDRNGKEVWETRVAGFSTQAVSFGDVDGDGVLDIVFGTMSGALYALRGDTGAVLPRFPIKLGGRVVAAVTLASLETRREYVSVAPALHLIVPAFDGHGE